MHDQPHARAALPQIVLDAFETIQRVFIELRSTGRIVTKNENFSLPDCAPPYWRIGHPKYLEFEHAYGIEVNRSPEQQAAHEAHLRDLDAEWEETRTLYREASAAYDTIAPLVLANDRLRYDLVAAGGDIVQIAKALRRFRQSIAFYTPRNAAMSAVLVQLDQQIDRIRDALRRLVIKRLFAGEFTYAEERELIGILEAEAASGAWADPEADLDEGEAQVNSIRAA